MSSEVDRRQFLRWAGKAGLGWGLALSSLNRMPWSMDWALASTEPFPDIAVAKGKSPGAITRAAIEALGGMGRFVSRGDVVVVKPNMGWDRVPEQAANTNPEVIQALVEMAYNAGAKKVKVFDNTCNEARRCYVRSGIQKAAQSAGAQVSFLDPRRFKELDIPGGQTLKRWPIYTEALEADKIINVPIAKHHSLTRLTLGMKNWFGLLGGNRSHLHQQADQVIVDLGLVFKPVLTVLDAYRVLTANGPQGGSLADVQTLSTVAAGTDQVAIDSFGASLFGLKGSDLSYLAKAAKMSLGQLDLNRLRIKRLVV